MYIAWARSSVGRAIALQAKGQEFESPRVHKMFSNKLSRIEKEIIELNKEAESDYLHTHLLIKVNKDARDLRLKSLERQRQIIIDGRREGYIQKIIFNILIPIVVTIITTFALKYFNLK